MKLRSARSDSNRLNVCIACKVPELLIHRGAFLLADVYQQPGISWCVFKSAFSAFKNVKNVAITVREPGGLGCSG